MEETGTEPLGLTGGDQGVGPEHQGDLAGRRLDILHPENPVVALEVVRGTSPGPGVPGDQLENLRLLRNQDPNPKSW